MLFRSSGKIIPVTGDFNYGQWHGEKYFAENVSMPGKYTVNINAEYQGSKSSIQTEMFLFGVASNRITITDPKN